MIQRDYLTMEDSVRQAKLGALEEERGAIHFANMLYWNCEVHSHEAELEHQRRQKRLGQVRKEYRRTESLKQEWMEFQDRYPLVT